MSFTDLTPDNVLRAFPPGTMVTLAMKLHAQNVELSLLMPDVEWHRLVADFSAMQPDERQRVGSSIRASVAHNPFPPAGEPLSPAQQETCDVFVNDCILLAALAESVGERVLMDTAVESYALLRGNKIRAKLN
jgi:hypothetical protein